MFFQARLPCSEEDFAGVMCELLWQAAYEILAESALGALRTCLNTTLYGRQVVQTECQRAGVPGWHARDRLAIDCGWQVVPFILNYRYL